MIVVLPADEFAAGAAARIGAALREAAAGIGEQGTGPGDSSSGGADAEREPASAPISLMLTGGATVRPVYEELAAVPDLPWTATGIYIGDERAVPPDHPDSNFRMARETLLDHVPVSDARIHRMEAEREDREAAARDYGRLLPRHVDVLLLGLGFDGHVASLFPGAPTLEERERLVVPSADPEHPHPRLTVTPPVIHAARRRIMLVSGERKAAAVRATLAETGPIAECPARMVGNALWVLDEAAAGEIEAAAGEIDAAAGEIDAAAGEIDAAAGEIDAAAGEIDAAASQIDAAPGTDRA